MYMYEEMDLNELLDDPEIDPDSAEALYAIAQCYRLGKGTQVNEELYRSNLEVAAQAGSEQAQQELDQASVQTAPAEDTASPADLPLYQQRRLADEGNPAAILQMAYNSLAMSDKAAALTYLQSAEKYVGQSVYTNEEEQDIFLQLGNLFSEAPLENPEKSAYYYGLANEMGSAQAAFVLSHYAQTGYGCQKDEQQAETWLHLAATRGDANLKYEIALQRLDVQPVFACSLLDEVVHSADDDRLRTCAKIILDARAAGSLPDEDIESAWSVCDEPKVRTLLTERYDFSPATSTPPVPQGMTLHALRVFSDGLNLLTPEGSTESGTVEGLPVTKERAEWLVNRATMGSRRRLWAECAALLGSQQAATWVKADDLCRKAMALLPQDPAQGIPLLRQAAELGSAAAANELGLRLHDGNGVEKNQEQAAYWLKKAADGDLVYGQYNYATLCLPGTVDSNPEKRSWIEQAAGAGFPTALYDLCLSKNPGDSLQRLEALASSGNTSAQYLIGKCFMFGEGTKQDKAKGFRWLHEAVRPRPEDQYDLKREVPLQYAFATASMADYLLCYNTNDPDQTFHLAQEAYNVHQSLLPQMTGPATICFASVLGNCYLHGIGTPVDYDRALACYRSADARYEYAPPALAALGRCYLYGYGVSKDLNEARRYFDQAQKGGYAILQKNLDDLAAAENTLKQQQQQQEQQRAEQERQAAFENDFVLCARSLLAIVLIFLFSWLFQLIHVPVLGALILNLLSIVQFVLIVFLLVKGYTLYKNTNGYGFASRLWQAFLAEGKALGNAVVGLFTSGSHHSK